MDLARGSQDWLSLLLGDVDRTLPRERLLKTFSRLRPLVVLLVAPSGYGKTTCAAQLAATFPDESRIWVKLEDSQPSPQRVLSALQQELEQLTGAEAVNLAKNLKEQELLHQVLATMSSVGTPLCLIIDDLGQLQDTRVLSSLARGLAELSPDSCLVVTTRQPVSIEEQGRSSTWTIGTDLLRFTPDESRAYLNSVSGGTLAPDTVEHLLRVSEGQVALLSVLARHAMSSGRYDSNPDRDASECFIKLVRTHCSSSEQDCLYASALLKTGRIGELVEIVGADASNDFRNASRDLPLVNVVDSVESTAARFIVHDIAEAILTSHEYEEYLGPSAPAILARALEVLYTCRNYDRLFELLLGRGDQSQVSLWLERVGEELALQCSTRLLARCLETIPATLSLTRPRLLLLQAHLLRLTDQLVEAERKARVVLQLARDVGDAQTEHRAALLLANISFDLGSFSQTRAYASSFLSEVEECESDDLAFLYSHLAKCSICLGEFDRASEEVERIKSLATAMSSRTAKGLGLMADGLLQGLVLGNTAEAVPAYSAVMKIDEVGVNLQLVAYGNLGTSLCELGRLHRAEAILNDVLSRACKLDLIHLKHSFSGSLAGVRAALGSFETCAETMEEAIRGSEALGCVFDVIMNSMYYSTMLRSCGRRDESLVHAEMALERSTEVGFLPGQWLASIELAASLLALGDETIPFARAKGIQVDPRTQACQHLQLRAAMLVAEIHNRRQEHEAATQALVPFGDYIRSESQNWVSAMYLRAFPGLLGVLANAVGSEHLPIHLLRMLLPQDVEAALPLARDVLSAEAWKDLASRLGSARGDSSPPLSDPEPECVVRMFGGLEVRTSAGIVPPRAWRKRKARLLFAMLAVRRGKDVPREQLLEYLWPEMDEERARNNLYVVWNAMKTALSPAKDGEGPPPVLVENAGGVCRVQRRLVRSDLDEFADAVRAAREAETSGDIDAAVGQYERLREIYRGELLPGDIYDDWFAPIREQYRHEFGDAMARCASLLEDDDPARGLGLARTALSFDPWREDLYQVALRLQITTGQRSAAIETYTACRTRLAEDLGLDPSVETRKLYDQVLAMEDPAYGPSDAA